MKKNVKWIVLLFVGMVSMPLAAQQWTSEQLVRANTARDASYLSEQEREVIFLCNLARMDGALFASTYLAQHTPNDPSNWYIASLYSDLQTVRNQTLLYPSEQLHKTAAYHALDMGRTGQTGHTSSDGTLCKDRIYAVVSTTYTAENCSYGFDDALNIVMQLLIDENVPSLGHRKNILNNNLNAVGVAIAPHTVYRYNCVMDFAKLKPVGQAQSQSQPQTRPQVQSQSQSQSQSPTIYTITYSEKTNNTKSTARGRYYDYNGKTAVTLLGCGVSAAYRIPDIAFVFAGSAELLTFRLRMFELAWLGCRYDITTNTGYWEPQVRLCIPVAQRCALLLGGGPSVRVLDEQHRFCFDSCYFTANTGVRVNLAKYLSLDYRIGYNGTIYTGLNLALQIPVKR